MPDNQTCAFIFARGGSKGVRGKNIRKLAGKPMIAYAIEAAKNSKYINRVVVSTDSDEIAAIARDWGAEAPFMRPAELATDDSAEWLSWQHAINQVRSIYGKDSCPVFVSIPATCPLRKTEDIDNCIAALKDGTEADIVLTVTASHSNPYFTMVTHDEKGYASLAAKPPFPVARRQDAPRVMDIVGVAYAANPDFILNLQGIWHGRVKTVEVPQERSLDIDTEYDMLVAELILRNGSGSRD
jgi:N,N'-diacetyl-8-epilegionaminate cytidylyltransferase